jgi:transposase
LYRQRWLILSTALLDAPPAQEIAKQWGVSKARVPQLISRYNRWAVQAVETVGKGGRRIG